MGLILFGVALFGVVIGRPRETFGRSSGHYGSDLEAENVAMLMVRKKREAQRARVQ